MFTHYILFHITDIKVMGAEPVQRLCALTIWLKHSNYSVFCLRCRVGRLGAVPDGAVAYGNVCPRQTASPSALSADIKAHQAKRINR